MRARSLLSALAVGLVVTTTALAQGAPAAVRETATTSDGAKLALKHYPVPGGPPVLMLHGIGSNMNEFDLPSKSFALYLVQQGYDVWLGNFRRVGKTPFHSTGRIGYSFDDEVASDLPAMVDLVTRTTGQKPFLLGHSMGGMVIESWLTGADLESVVISRRLSFSWSGFRWKDVHGRRVTGSDQRAAARNSAIRGAVAIESPNRFLWPENDSTFVWNFWQHDYWNENILLRDLSYSPAAEAATYVFTNVPGREITDFLFRDLLTLPYVGPTMAPYLAYVETNVGTSFLATQLLYPPNMEPQPIQDGAALAIDSTSGVIFRQFMDGIRGKTMREQHVLDPLHDPYVYPDHWDRITAPILITGGSYDKLANANTIQYDGLPSLGSADKTFLGIPYGHVDAVIGRDAPADVWAPIAAWLASH